MECAQFFEEREIEGIAGFDADPFERQDFQIFTLDDLDDEQIVAFTKAWFDLARISQTRILEVALVPKIVPFRTFRGALLMRH